MARTARLTHHIQGKTDGGHIQSLGEVLEAHGHAPPPHGIAVLRAGMHLCQEATLAMDLELELRGHALRGPSWRVPTTCCLLCSVVTGWHAKSQASLLATSCVWNP